MTATINKQAYFQKIGHVPHPKQQLFHDSTARFRIAVCGRRFGKSFMGARDEEPNLLIPKRRVWCVGPTYDLAEKEFRVMWDDMIIGLRLGKNKQVKKAYNKRSGDMYIEFPWQTRVECRSADHPENLVGERLDHVIMSEAAKHKKDTWERFIQPALADRHGTATFPTTPEGFNWLYDLWSMGQNPHDKEFASWQFPSWDNPIVYPEGRYDPEIILLERTLAPEYFEQEIAASFTAFMGKIYGEFSEVTHVKEHTYNPDWPNYMCIDPGYTNPLAAIEIQVSPRDEIFVWREHYKAYMTLEEHIAAWKNRPQPPGYKVDLCFSDAADPEAAMYISQHFAPCIALPEAKANWREGVDLVKTFLRMRSASSTIDLTEMTETLDLSFAKSLERPGLTIDHKCPNTIREFNGYRSPQTRTMTNPREAAQKYDDHALDALRYGLMHLYKLGCNTHLSDLYTHQGLVRPGDGEPAGWMDRPDDTDMGQGFFSFETNGTHDGFFNTNLEF